MLCFQSIIQHARVVANDIVDGVKVLHPGQQYATLETCNYTCDEGRLTIWHNQVAMVQRVRTV